MLYFRVPKDINCLRVVECIWGADIRSKRLRSELAQQILSNCLAIEANSTLPFYFYSTELIFTNLTDFAGL